MTTPSNEHQPPDSTTLLLERAAAAGIEVETRELEHLSAGRARTYFVLQMPNGRRTRRITLFPRDLDAFLETSFENYTVLGDYLALVDKQSGVIECQVVGAGAGGRITIGNALQRLPGVEVAASANVDPDRDDLDEVVAETNTVPAEQWRLLVERDGRTIEISPPSADFEVILGRGVTIKISGIPTASHDGAVDALKRYAQALLFDLDVVYGVPAQLGKVRRANRPRRRDAPDHAPKFPRNQYSEQPLELYQYGRSAAGLPSLEYLAYYQSVEFFFPYFAREETVNSVRSQLLHPGFDPQNDASLNKLINLAAPAARGGMAEKEQLRATVRACVPEADIRDFLESLPEYIDHFCSKSPAIRGVGVIRLDQNPPDLRDQAADRIYAIRCRIVHAKQDGGGTNEDVLLPSSTETGSLQADIELVRLIAQRALVARAARA